MFLEEEDGPSQADQKGLPQDELDHIKPFLFSAITQTIGAPDPKLAKVNKY